MDSLTSTATALNIGSYTIQDMILGIIATIIIGIIVSFTYMKTTDRHKISQSFILTLIIIPAVICVIIALIGNNVASAFSLAGAFSIVRFRSEPGDPKDIGYIFFSMAGGLACGMELYINAIIFTVVLCAIMFLLNKIKFGSTNENQKTLKILIPEDYDFENAFSDLLNTYTDEASITKVKTIDLGSVYEISYAISLKENINQKEFIDNIRSRNGNLTVLLSVPQN